MDLNLIAVVVDRDHNALTELAIDDDGHEIAPAKLAGRLMIDLGHCLSILARLSRSPACLASA